MDNENDKLLQISVKGLYFDRDLLVPKDGMTRDRQRP